MSGDTCIISCIYQGKSEKALKTHIKAEGKFFWLPISQISNVWMEDEVEIGPSSYGERLSPGDELLVRIPVWLACKLLHCEGRQALEDLGLSYLDID